MTDTLAVGRITYPPIERYTWIFTPAPDPRDARIAELEAALLEIQIIAKEVRAMRIWTITNSALMPSPEGDMRITQEELGA